MNLKIIGRKLQDLDCPKTSSHPNLSFLSWDKSPSPFKTLKTSFSFSDTQINFAELIQDYQIKDVAIFSNYLLQIWKSLAKRTESPIKGIQKITFMNYYDLPSIISDRLFSSFDKAKNGFLNSEDFIEGMTLWFSQPFEALSKFIFSFYDFDQDGFITKEDVRVVLSYVPLQKRHSKLKMKYEQEDFRDRAESQTELHDCLNKAFGQLEKMNEDQFIDVIDNVNSDIFVFIWMFLFEKRPFTRESITVFVNTKNDTFNSMMSCKTPKIEPHKIASPSLKSKFLSPSLKNRTFNWTKQNNILNAYLGASGLGNGGNKRTLIKHTDIIAEEKKCETPKVKPQRKKGKLFDNIEGFSPHMKQFSLQVKNDPDESISDSESEKEDGQDKGTPSPFTAEGKEVESKPIIFSSYWYKKTRSNKLKLKHFRLIGKDFYVFASEDDEWYQGMHNWSGIYFHENPPETHDTDKWWYNFSICYPQKSRTYYTENKDDYLTWINHWTSVLDSQQIWERYDVKQQIGKGKYGWVKLAVHRETKRKVAIKIMTKSTMSVKDLELAKTEIDILKVCQHPNIIKLYDIIDSQDYIYIIMEYCAGKDLFGYIEERNYRLSEKRTAEIIHQLSMAVYYIHSYGIVHRDWKPENIWMTDNSDTADIRLWDFGLSKIIRPNEKCRELYGTWSYIAPEVLMEEPYDKRVDLWTIGIITYLWLCGFLPFDDETSEKEIVRQTIQDAVEYPKDLWDDFSQEVRDWVEKTVMKEPDHRLTIEEILEHEWFKKYGLVPEFRSKLDKYECNFVKYATDKST